VLVAVVIVRKRGLNTRKIELESKDELLDMTELLGKPEAIDAVGKNEGEPLVVAVVGKGESVILVTDEETEDDCLSGILFVY